MTASVPSHSKDTQYPCALRSALSTAGLPHEVNKEQADTTLRCGIGLRVGRNTAHSEKSKGGKAARSIGRTGGLLTGKGEFFPFYPLYAIFNQHFTFPMSGNS